MIDFVALPLVGVLVTALVAGPLFARLGPRAAAKAYALVLVGVLAASVPTVWLVGLSGLVHATPQNPLIDWSRHVLPDHRPAGAVVGIGFLVWAVVGTVRAVHVLRVHHELRCTDTCPIEFVDSDQMYAYTIPGPAGTIAVSDGLHRSLDEQEFAVVLAHERTHARHRHDRFKLLAMVAVAVVPPIRSVARRLDHQLERWADEEALVRIGGDRRLAARTIAKVALATPSPVGSLAIGGHGTVARARALLEPAPEPSTSARFVIGSLLLTSLALAIYQLHHNALFMAYLVP